MDLDNRVAVVTGASSGIGESTARRLAADGATVVVAARREERLAALVDGIEDDGGTALAVPTDVRDEDAVADLIDTAHETYDRLDVLVNNAGVSGGHSTTKASPEEFRQVVEVNLLGAMYATRAALPHLRESDLGHVVNVSSSNAKTPPAGGGGYNASKTGLNGLSETVRQETVGHDVRVTTVMPGRVDTEIADWSEWDGRPLQPADVADAIGAAIAMPGRASVNELVLRPTDQRYP